MIFSYVRYKVELTPTIPSGEVYRPMVPIRLIGPKSSVQVFGLLDTGADHVFVSMSLADTLGIDVGNESEQALGAGGHSIEVRTGSIEIEITQNGERLRWSVAVGFLAGDDYPPIAYLGHAGFLENFTAVFDTTEWSIELLPHDNVFDHG